MIDIRPTSVRCGTASAVADKTRDLIGEAPVAVWIQDRPYAVLLCTPKERRPLAAGFCLSEGLIRGPEDIAAVVLDPDGARVHVTLAAAHRDAVRQRLAAAARPTSPDLWMDEVPPLPAGPRFDAQAVRARLEALDALQPLRARTRAAHAAALYDERLALLAVAEDVGRHNALDKAVGKLVLDGGFARIRLIVLSSRISFEMAQKAARARASLVVAVSRPTALAVETARRLNMTLANPHGPEGLCVYCGAERLGMAGVRKAPMTNDQVPGS